MKNELSMLAVTIQSIKTLADRGCAVNIHTQEIPAKDMTKLFQLKGQSGYMVFKPAKITLSDIANIPKEVKEFKTDKSPSKRLRAVLFVLWNTTTSKKESFDSFYKRHMEALINQYKDRLS